MTTFRKSFFFLKSLILLQSGSQRAPIPDKVSCPWMVCSALHHCWQLWILLWVGLSSNPRILFFLPSTAIQQESFSIHGSAKPGRIDNRQYGLEEKKSTEAGRSNTSSAFFVNVNESNLQNVGSYDADEHHFSLDKFNQNWRLKPLVTGENKVNNDARVDARKQFGESFDYPEQLIKRHISRFLKTAQDVFFNRNHVGNQLKARGTQFTQFPVILKQFDTLNEVSTSNALPVTTAGTKQTFMINPTHFRLEQLPLKSTRRNRIRGANGQYNNYNNITSHQLSEASRLQHKKKFNGQERTASFDHSQTHHSKPISVAPYRPSPALQRLHTLQRSKRSKTKRSVKHSKNNEPKKIHHSVESAALQSATPYALPSTKKHLPQARETKNKRLPEVPRPEKHQNTVKPTQNNRAIHSWELPSAIHPASNSGETTHQGLRENVRRMKRRRSGEVTQQPAATHTLAPSSALDELDQQNTKQFYELPQAVYPVKTPATQRRVKSHNTEQRDAYPQSLYPTLPNAVQGGELPTAIGPIGSPATSSGADEFSNARNAAEHFLPVQPIHRSATEPTAISNAQNFNTENLEALPYSSTEETHNRMTNSNGRLQVTPLTPRHQNFPQYPEYPSDAANEQQRGLISSSTWGHQPLRPGLMGNAGNAYVENLGTSTQQNVMHHLELNGTATRREPSSYNLYGRTMKVNANRTNLHDGYRSNELGQEIGKTELLTLSPYNASKHENEQNYSSYQNYENPLEPSRNTLTRFRPTTPTRHRNTTIKLQEDRNAVLQTTYNEVARRKLETLERSVPKSTNDTLENEEPESDEVMQVNVSLTEAKKRGEKLLNSINITPLQRAVLAAEVTAAGRRLALLRIRREQAQAFPTATLDALLYLARLDSMGHPVALQFRPGFRVKEREWRRVHQDILKKAVKRAANNIVTRLTSQDKIPGFSLSLGKDTVTKLRLLRSITLCLCRLRRSSFVSTTGECHLQENHYDITVNAKLLPASPFALRTNDPQETETFLFQM